MLKTPRTVMLRYCCSLLETFTRHGTVAKWQNGRDVKFLAWRDGAALAGEASSGKNFADWLFCDRAKSEILKDKQC